MTLDLLASIWNPGDERGQEAMPIPYFVKKSDRSFVRIYPGIAVFLYTLIFTFVQIQTKSLHSTLFYTILLALSAVSGIYLVESGHRGSGLPLLRNLFKGNFRNLRLRLFLLPIYVGAWFALASLWTLCFYSLDLIPPPSDSPFVSPLLGELFFRAGLYSLVVWLLSRRKGYSTSSYLWAAGITAILEGVLTGFVTPAPDRFAPLSAFLFPIFPGFLLGAIHFRHGLETAILTRFTIYFFVSLLAG